MKGNTMKNLYFFIAISVVTFYSSLNAQWIRTNGPYVGDVCTFAISGSNLFAGTTDFFVDSGGVFLSTNDGSNWIATGFQGTIVSALVITGTNLFAGTPYGIFHSTNNGTSWADLNTFFSNNDVRALVVSGTNLFAGTYGGGVYRSTNNGLDWTTTGLTSTIVIAFVVSGTNLFAGTFAEGVYLSTDDGTIWTEVNSGLTGNHVTSLAVSGTNLFAGTNDGVFLSTSNGSNWTAGGLQDTLVSALATSGTNLFAGTSDILGISGSVFLSINNGINWTEVSSGLPNTGILALTISGTNLFAGTVSSGVWRRPLSEMITDVEEVEQLPNYFALEQNYPNPFNPSTKIRYSVPQSSNVMIKVFDILGNEIETLVNEVKPQGTYEITWYATSAAGGLPSGVYFYQLRASDPSSGSGQGFFETKKMILLK
jgi:photosystem II stability/assembly factor-like uncharacterized protein